RAQRQPHGDLVLSRRRTRQQQVRDIGARDQQHDANNGHQQEQRLAIVLAETRYPFCERRDAECGFSVLRRGLRARICRNRRLEDARRERRQTRAALLQSDAWFKPTDDPPAPAVGSWTKNRPGALRRPDRRVIPILHTEERRLGHAYDLEWLPVNHYRLANDVRAAAVLALPERMGDDGHSGTASIIVGVRKRTPDHRRRPERREKAATHEANRGRARFAACAEISACRAVDKYSGEHILLVPDTLPAHLA